MNTSAETPQTLLTIDNHVATITLNRPAKLNALTLQMLDELEEMAGRLEQERAVRVIILTGAGERAFCVGADITAWSALEPLDMWRRWVRHGHRVFARIARLPQPVIAALNGYTFGGGLELALAADLRLAAEHVELAMPEVKIGTAPGWGGTQRLPQIIGPARAKQMIFTGQRVAAAVAAEWGLINEVAPRESLLDRAHALAAEIAQNAPLSVQMAKQMIDGGLGDNVSMTLEALVGALAASSEDGQEGVAAFREKRSPRFENR